MIATLKKICGIAFNISMPGFMIIGTIIVLTQIFACITLNGALCLSINKMLRNVAGEVCTVCLFAAFIDSYLKVDGEKEKKEE